MLIVCPSTGNEQEAVRSWVVNASESITVRVEGATHGEEAGYLYKVQKAYKESTAEILAYFHSDLIIHEKGWDQRVVAEFDRPDTALVSFGGANSHGHPDIYKLPYDYRHLGRDGWRSNLTDAEKHGTREAGSCDVAVVDSFALIMRRSFLDRVDGWPVDRYPPSHCGDYWACLSAHRLGLSVRMVGISCTHSSGGVRGDGSFNYPEWCKTTKWGSDEEMHRVSHRLIYDEFRNVLPVRIR